MKIIIPSIDSEFKAIAKNVDNLNVEELQSYWCSSCGQFFKNFKLLMTHLKTKHQNAPIGVKRSKTKDKIDRKKINYNYYSRY